MGKGGVSRVHGGILFAMIEPGFAHGNEYRSSLSS